MEGMAGGVYVQSTQIIGVIGMGAGLQEGMLWTTPWNGVWPMSVFMLKWLVFAGLHSCTRPLIDRALEPKQDGAKVGCPISKGHLHLYWFDRRVLPRPLCNSCHASLALNLNRTIFGMLSDCVFSVRFLADQQLENCRHWCKHFIRLVIEIYSGLLCMQRFTGTHTYCIDPWFITPAQPPLQTN